MLRDIRTLYESNEENHKSIKINNAFNGDYIEYENDGDQDNILSVKEHVEMIRQYLSNIINNHETQNQWKIQLLLAINFVSSEDFKESRTTHRNNDNIDIEIGNETDRIIEELFESLLERYIKRIRRKNDRK